MLSALLPALALAAHAARPDAPPLTEQSLDRLIDLPITETLSTGTFRHLHGFQGTDHLAPVLVPVETRYRGLQDRQEVRDALTLAPDLGAFNERLWAAVRADWADEEEGRNLLAAFSEGLPPLLLAEIPELSGSYRPRLDAIALHWKDIRRMFPEAADMDCSELQRFLLQDPARVTRLAADFAPVLLHELVHARQAALLGFERDRMPKSGHYVELEQEAYLVEARFLIERLERRPSWLGASALEPVYREVLERFAHDLDEFLAGIERAYVSTGRTMPLKSALSQQRKAVREAQDEVSRLEARAVLARLENSAAYHGQVRERAKRDWPGLAVVGSARLSRATAATDPVAAIRLALHSAKLAARHGLSSAQALAAFNEATRAQLKRAEPLNDERKGAWAATVGGWCDEAALDCGELLAELRK